MAINYQLEENKVYNLKEKMKSDSINYFDTCPKCSQCQNNIKDWMKHLVDRHPLPIEWMSNAANYLTDEKIMKPYTTVTESRKKRKKSITPRPLNSFMIFSRHLRRNTLIFFNDASNSEISKLLGKLWNNISSPIKSMYDTEAKKLAALHSKEFPEYKYQPKKKKKLYSSKRNTDSCTPLSNYSFESVSDNVPLSTTDVMRCNSFQKDTASYRNCQDTKSNLFINHNSKTNNFTKMDIHKSVKKTSKTVHKVSISNHILDDSEGAESSPSSFKNTIRTEIISTYSPFNNGFNSDHSDLNFDSLIKQKSDHLTIIPKTEATIFKHLNDSNKFNVNKYNHIFHRNTSSATNLTTPLTIVTDKVDDQNSLPIIKTNMSLVKIVNKDSHEMNTKKPATTVGGGHSQSSLIDFKETNESPEFDNDVHHPNPDSIGKHLPSSRYNNHSISEMSRKCTNLDPLLFEDIFDNDNYEDDSLNLTNIINNNNNNNNNSNNNNNGSPWAFKSPNFKPFAGSSNLSDKETYEASSPFHLSENENHPTPIQRLPAIGSWLRSTYSEFMI